MKERLIKISIHPSVIKTGKGKPEICNFDQQDGRISLLKILHREKLQSACDIDPD